MARVLPRSVRTLALPLALAASACASTEPVSTSASALDEGGVDAAIARGMAEAHLPGLAACVVRGGEVAWCKGYGLADVAARRPVTPDTPFLLASVSKVFTATALMSEWEKGAFGLDDDVSDAAGFPIEHPKGTRVITYRRLLAHAGSVADGPAMGRFYAHGKDPDLTLDQVVRGYFVPGGAYYDASENFLRQAPGTVYRYSNMGYALLGYLAGRVAKGDFAALTEETIFAPLAMKDTSWHLADFPPGHLAVPYRWNGHAFESYGQYTFADYPNGALRSTARSVATFLAAQAGGKLLQEATLDRMLEPTYPALDAHQGLAWRHVDLGGEDWVGHTGGESGVYTEMFLRRRDGMGIVVLTNGDMIDSRPMLAIEKALVALGDGRSP
jgi:CubicO group peptidase (beta-lactamase class C family)